MVKFGAGVMFASLMMVGAAFADTYVTAKVVNPPGPGKVVVKKVVHTRTFRPAVVRSVIVRPFAVIKRRPVVIVHVD